MKEQTKKTIDRLRNDCKHIIEDCENEDPFYIDDSEKKSIGDFIDTNRGHLAACDIRMSLADMNSWITSYFAFHSLDHSIADGAEQELCDAAVLLRAAIEKLEDIYENSGDIQLNGQILRIDTEAIGEYVKYSNFDSIFDEQRRDKQFIEWYQENSEGSPKKA